MLPERYIAGIIRKLAFTRHKICLLSGPRQVGKTTAARYFLKERKVGGYWNWDEIDFLVLKDRKPWLPVEVKSGDTKPSPHWRVFMPQIPCELGMQVVRSLHVDKIYSEHKKNVRVLSADAFLSVLP